MSGFDDPGSGYVCAPDRFPRMCITFIDSICITTANTISYLETEADEECVTARSDSWKLL